LKKLLKKDCVYALIRTVCSLFSRRGHLRNAIDPYYFAPAKKLKKTFILALTF